LSSSVTQRGWYSFIQAEEQVKLATENTPFWRQDQRGGGGS